MKTKRVLLRVGQFALIVLVTLGIIRTLAPELAKVSADDFARFRPSVIGILQSLILLLGFYLVHAELWRRIAAQLGERSFSFRTAMRIYFLSGLGRYIPGKVWQVAGMALLAQRAGLSAVAATGAAFLAQFAFVTTGLIYLAAVLPSWGGFAPVVIAVFAVAVVVASYRSRHWIARKITRLAAAVEMLDRLSAITVLKWWLAYGVSWIVLGSAFVIFTNAFVPLDLAQQRHVAGTVAAAYLGGLLAFFSPAGLGVREGVMGSLLVAAPLPAAAALVVAVASRVWFTAGELLPLLYVGRGGKVKVKGPER